MKLTFLGAAGTVTGSKYLLEYKDKKVLIDCGLFQGLKSLRLMNWDKPPFRPDEIDAILITHGHLDHIGYLPRLVKLGYQGPIYASEPTIKVSEISLQDSARIQEEEAERANREGYSKHKPALAFYDEDDAKKTQKLFKRVPEGEWVVIDEWLQAMFLYNGHIIGSTFIQVEVEGRTLVFSGDIGRDKDMLLYPPKKPKKADVLLTESTYGGKLHPEESSIVAELEEVVDKTLQRGGSLFIPSFAVERTQLLMLILWRLVKDKRIPRVPMIMDSPMGADVLELFESYQKWHKLSAQDYKQICAHFRIVSSFKETLQIRGDREPKIVIAGSGMLTGGRILSYLEERAGNPNDTLLFVGYQAEGTRGRALQEGAQEIKMYGKMVAFRMQVHSIEGLSAHADQHDLIDWLSDLEQAPQHLFIVHGELDQAQAFQQKLKEVKGWQAEIPELNQTVDL